VRAAWRAEVATADPTTFVFLDETSTPTTLTPTRAWAPRGERAVGRVPHRRWHNVTLLATLTPGGMGEAMVINGAANRRTFDAFVQQRLVPALRPGQTVVLDNLSVHKSRRAREAIEAAGCTVRFLPPYSPDFNPIELAFAKIKTHVRRSEPRSYAEVVAATKPALNAVSAADARGYFRHLGYPLPEPIGQPL
jgi:transposase